jgi:hypothetical protein
MSLLVNPGAYPKARVDVTLSSDDNIVHLPEPDAPVDEKVSADDDAGNNGATIAEPTAPGLISSIVLKQSKPSVADRVLNIVPPSGRHGRKHPPPAIKWSNLVPLADQVMTQVELPPFRGPHSPLDLVAIEFIFRHIFEAFQQISQVVASGVMSANDNKPLKRFHQPSLKKVLMSRYPCVLFLYLTTCYNSNVCYSVGHPMLMSHQEMMSRNQLMCW